MKEFTKEFGDIQYINAINVILLVLGLKHDKSKQ